MHLFERTEVRSDFAPKKLLNTVLYVFTAAVLCIKLYNYKVSLYYDENENSLYPNASRNS